MRTCTDCGCTLFGLHPLCQDCREKNCPHTETHFDSARNHICVCGRVIAKHRIGQMISDKTAEQIRILHRQGLKHKTIMHRLRVRQTVVSNVLNGKTHRIDRIVKGTKRSCFVPSDWANTGR
jgi:predicted XRE-type DNA-binding protein